MTPTTPLAGLLFGLLAGLLVAGIVVLALRLPWIRKDEPERSRAKAWSTGDFPVARKTDT